MILSSCMINNSWRECQKRKDDRLRVQNTRACRFDVLNTIKGIIFSAVNVAVWTDIGNCPYRLVFTCLQLKLELTCIVQANDPPWAERCECTHLPDCIKILTHMHKCMYTHNKKTAHTHTRARVANGVLMRPCEALLVCQSGCSMLTHGWQQHWATSVSSARFNSAKLLTGL